MTCHVCVCVYVVCVSPTVAEQLAVGIDLLKLRLGFMNSDQRKQYLQCVATLIEKSPVSDQRRAHPIDIARNTICMLKMT